MCSEHNCDISDSVWTHYISKEKIPKSRYCSTFLTAVCIQAMPHNFSLTSHSFLAIPSSLASGLTCTSWQSEKYRPLRCSMFSCSAQYSVVWDPDTGSVAQNLLTMVLIICVCHSLMSRASSDLTDPETDQTQKTGWMQQIRCFWLCFFFIFGSLLFSGFLRILKKVLKILNLPFHELRT